MKDVLKDLNPCLLLTLHGLNSDSHLEYPDPTFDGINEFKVNNSILYDEIADCRVFKTSYEIDVIRYTNFVSSKAHKHVMRAIRNGMTEFQCESLFLNFCYLLGGCRHVSYTCICGSGQNSSVLHYGHAGAPNDKVIKQKDICLFDMGCSYYGYSSDITCSFPVSGKFSDDQKLIYNAVLAANQAVFHASKPGVSWVDMHRLANKVLLTHLRDGGLLKGEIDDMMNANLGAVFQPHGLGHLMGCDVHDVGGYLKKNPSRPSGAGLSNLRTARILEAGMVMTNEPGCYFIDFLLKQASEDPIQSKFLVPEVIERFRNSGGVRIEDDILITENGAENLTTVPRTVEEIEKWMNSDEEEPLHRVLEKNIVSLEYNLSNGHNQEAI